LNITIDRDYLLKTLTDLIAINSINLSLAPAGRGEAEIAAYIAQSLRGLGLRVALHDAEHSRTSAVATLKGGGQGRSLMLNGHIDTVDAQGMDNPFAAKIRDGKVFGRGAYDMKGSVAACMAALKALVDSGVSLKGDVLLAAVADEEYASLGSADVINRYHVDAAIVTEPTQMKVCLAHKGFIWLEVETEGRAAHGSRFDEGIDANMRMGRFLAELDKLEQDLRRRPGHALVGPPSLHAAMINGGSELSVYAAKCQLKIERRTIPGESEAQVIGELQGIIDRLAAADSTFKATVKSLFTRNPFSVASDTAIVQAVGRAATHVLGQSPAHIGETYWADAALLAEAGVETVMIGPSGGGAHANVEWVDLQSLLDLAQILAEVAVDYCG
jgi:acetylornithine deacetylase